MKKLLPTEYPQNLKVLGEYVPQCIYIKGDFEPRDCLAVAVVGSRTPTGEGRKKAYEIACVLASEGITIVSGLARGIDTEAHRAALKVSGRTIAVLGSGLSNIYPPENIDLAREIQKSGALVSEFKPDTKPLPDNFLARNRIIAALSLAVVVVEGKRRSGTISTARHAAELGREVFAVEGSESGVMSQAPNYLISEGAVAISGPGQVLDYIKDIAI
ncbi:DNA-protecting protein DprA [Candidatus Microgenomates bacterium]|nr:MAG: DNA-protecting protein DprA [Candidatus Microgenomates bacterium]